MGRHAMMLSRWRLVGQPGVSPAGVTPWSGNLHLRPAGAFAIDDLDADGLADNTAIGGLHFAATDTRDHIGGVTIQIVLGLANHRARIEPRPDSVRRSHGRRRRFWLLPQKAWRVEDHVLRQSGRHDPAKDECT